MSIVRIALIASFAAVLVSFAPVSITHVGSSTHAGDKKKSAIDLALEKVFPACKIERITCRLDEKQRGKVGKLSAQKTYRKKTTFAYIARKDGKVVGTAFFDSHVVRTKRETLLVAVTPSGDIKEVVTIAFKEPREFIAQDSFYDSLEGRGQGRALQLGRGLDGTTGATLTCRAVADASRRVLALHEVLGERVGRRDGDAKAAASIR